MKTTACSLVLPLTLTLLACGGGGGSSVSKADLPTGDSNCPTGGVALTVDGKTSYVCNGGSALGGAVTLTQLQPGDSHCATGGTAVSNGSVTNYVCSGAQGSTGATGPSGGGLYTSRNNVYCRQAVMANDPSVWTLSVSCLSDKDLPLTGSCEGTPPYNVSTSTQTPIYLVLNSPGFWEGENLGHPATWDCAWFNNKQQAVNVPDAHANICCIAHP
jgi:hypothetical protein